MGRNHTGNKEGKKNHQHHHLVFQPFPPISTRDSTRRLTLKGSATLTSALSTLPAGLTRWGLFRVILLFGRMFVLFGFNLIVCHGAPSERQWQSDKITYGVSFQCRWQIYNVIKKKGDHNKPIKTLIYSHGYVTYLWACACACETQIRDIVMEAQNQTRAPQSHMQIFFSRLEDGN